KWLRGDYTFTAHFKYSFMRAKTSDYEPMVYAEGERDPLMKKYGYFQTVVENKGLVYPQEITILANRWHPKKQHTFYFAKDYPEQWKWIWNHPERGVFAKTNALFKKHGLNNYNADNNTCTTGLCFEIKENDGDKEFGDIRYSFIKLYDEPDPGAPFGYGPSDANPFTGEIIGANTILWTGYLEVMVKRLASDLERQTNDEIFQSSPLIQQMARTLKTENVLQPSDYRKAWTFTSERMRNTPQAMDAYYDILPEFTYGFPGWSRFTARPLPGGHGAAEPVGPLRAEPSTSVPNLLDTSVLGNVEEFPYAGTLLQSDEFSIAMQGLDDHLSFFHEGHNHQRNSTVYFGEDHFLDARQMLLAGRSKEDAINSIMYRVSIHEFGHNLSLRHNFYGSVDKRNFREPYEDVIMVDGKPQTIMRQQTTSSVMEYQNLKQEYYLDESWENYDEAALVYAYSDRKIDLSEINNTRYLFCTDEHRVLNALCNTWDHGTTPSEIALNMVEDYDLMYYVMNERFDRPYWDTRGYASRIAGRMYAMKKFLALYTTSMVPPELDRELRRQGKVTGEDIDLVKQRINMDVAQANNIVAAFYDGVVNYKRSEKDYLPEYDPWTGEITQIGISADKIYAMFFLMGDSPLFYNPNRYRAYTSFVEFAQDSILSPTVDRVLENTFTARIDMTPGFSGFGRVLFALNAYNFYNRDDTRLLDRIKVDCFTPATFEKEIGLNPQNREEYRCADADELPENLGWGMLCPSSNQVSSSSGYQDVAGTNEKIGMIEINGNYYLMKELQNSYTFEFVERMINNDVNGIEPGALEPWKAFIRESYMLYWGVKEGRVPECK
ncbi:MAG: zinc-dependent metalloprotease, partial [Bdellovibrionales bacterium]|nr:zinc-dependent metalloprotease [Bdellovibrionales bacterium]